MIAKMIASGVLLGVLIATTGICPAGPAMAQTNEAVADAREIYLAGDFETALRVLVPAADAGDPQAQNLVAAAFQYGEFLPTDAAEALRYFTLAAAQGYPPALHNLGFLY